MVIYRDRKERGRQRKTEAERSRERRDSETASHCEIVRMGVRVCMRDKEKERNQ